MSATRVYYGRPTAPAIDESALVGRYLGWSEEMIEQAAEVGARNGDDLGAAAVEAVCKALIELGARHSDRLQLAEQLRVAAETERNRLAALHARVSLENVQLRHQIAGTTPVAIDVAIDRAARAITGKSAVELNAYLDAQFDVTDTTVVDTPLTGGAR